VCFNLIQSKHALYVVNPGLVPYVIAAVNYEKEPYRQLPYFPHI
jgi:hypothetical protein